MILHLSPFLAGSSFIAAVCRIKERAYNVVYLPVLGEAFESEMSNDDDFTLLWDNYDLVRIHHEHLLRLFKKSLSNHIKILQEISWDSHAKMMANLLDVISDV